MAFVFDDQLSKVGDIPRIWEKLVELEVHDIFDIHPVAEWDVHWKHAGLTLVRRDTPHVRHWLKSFKEIEQLVKNSLKMHPYVNPNPSHALLEDAEAAT